MTEVKLSNSAGFTPPILVRVPDSPERVFDLEANDFREVISDGYLVRFYSDISAAHDVVQKHAVEIVKDKLWIFTAPHITDCEAQSEQADPRRTVING